MAQLTRHLFACEYLVSRPERSFLGCTPLPRASLEAKPLLKIKSAGATAAVEDCIDTIDVSETPVPPFLQLKLIPGADRGLVEEGD
jgi:hypothetical protein